MKERLSTPAMALIWFGAAVSLAEILTGTFFAPLGFEQGIAAIIIGHIIGCGLFFLAGLIGAKTRKSAMETVKLAFGKRGSLVFSISNVAQLVGWTAIMIVSGASAATFLVPALGPGAWCLIIGALIVLWIALGLKHMSWLQSVAAILLFGCTVVLSFVVFGGAAVAPVSDTAAVALSFGAAVELAVAMPLSWLPVVSDYTRSAKQPLRATIVATATYFFGSIWMFTIGLGAALFAGTGDIAVILASAGLGVVGILVVVFSTVTTTFLDAASAGVSAQSIFPRINAKYAGIIAAVVGTALAMVAPTAGFEGFLYLIGSIFAPMIAVLAVSFYVLREDSSERAFNTANLILWVGGFALYRVSMTMDFVVGNTLPVMIVVGLATFVVHKIMQAVKSRKDARDQVSTPNHLEEI